MSAEWFVHQNGKQTGPFTAAQLKQMADTGKLAPDDLVAKDGSKQWTPARQLKGLSFGITATKQPNLPPLPRQFPPLPGADVALRVYTILMTALAVASLLIGGLALLGHFNRSGRQSKDAAEAQAMAKDIEKLRAEYDQCLQRFEEHYQKRRGWELRTAVPKLEKASQQYQESLVKVLILLPETMKKERRQYYNDLSKVIGEQVYFHPKYMESWEWERR